MDASHREVELSRVACLLDELDGREFNAEHWKGYHPNVYCQPDAHGDALVSALCDRLQRIDVKKYSLEMQMWWRDHQRADKERIEKELAEKQTAAARRAALAKLTKHERKLLGL